LNRIVKKSISSSHGGFTLMEMLIVLTIIGLLMGMVIYHLSGVSEMAQGEKVDSDLLSFKELLAAYQLESGSLPTTEQGLKALWEKPTAEPVPDRWKAMLEGETKDPWGRSYQYRNPGKHNPDRYDVFSMGPDGLPDTDDDIGNWKKTSSSTTP
jgi:general secretion pathway protein G